MIKKAFEAGVRAALRETGAEKVAALRIDTLEKTALNRLKNFLKNTDPLFRQRLQRINAANGDLPSVVDDIRNNDERLHAFLPPNKMHWSSQDKTTYDYAEKVLGKRIHPATEQSDDAIAFWKNRAMRKEGADHSLINQQDLTDHRGIAAVIRDPKGRVLVQKHNKWGFWTIPVGKVYPGDGYLKTLRKEIGEETGISVGKAAPLGQKTITYNRGGKNVKVTSRLYDILSYGGRPKNMEPQKHSVQRFMSIDKLRSLGNENLSDMTRLFLEKHSSTAYSRWLAKSLGGTPKSVTKPLYQEAVERSGKTGRDAFRLTGSSAEKLDRKRISMSDPLNRHPDKHRGPGDDGGYASFILRHKRHHKPLHPNVAKGTIAKDPRIRRSVERHRSVRDRGVGDLRFGTAKERLEANRAKNRVDTGPAHRIEADRARKRKENMTPDQVEAARARTRKEHMTTEQLRQRRERVNAWNNSRREENPDMIKMEDAHRNYLNSLRRKGFILTKKGSSDNRGRLKAIHEVNHAVFK